jgi:PBP1b-binding outer membrane lipoprotein LpoB
VDSEPELKKGVTTLSSADVRTASEQMAKSLLGKMAEIHKGEGVPTVAVLRLKNNTKDYIDTEILTDQIRQILMKESGGKIAFLDRASLEAIAREREAKRKGALGSTGEKVLLGANYFLTGALRSLDKVAGSRRWTYTYVDVRLTDAESSQILWEESYEVKKEGRSGFYDR